MGEQGGKKIIIGILVSLVLIIAFGILAIPKIVEVNREKSMKTAFDIQIRSELSQIRSNAEQYYYGNGDGSYIGFDSSNSWKQVSTEIPDCTGQDSYQINISDQEYVIWSPLCSEEGFHCVDSERTSENFQEKIGEGYSCQEVFD